MLKKNLIALISVVSLNAYGYKECSNLEIKYVFSDGSNTYIGHSGPNSMDGIIRNTRTDYKGMVSIVLAARVSGEKVKIRFVDDTVICGQTSWNSEISGIGF